MVKHFHLSDSINYYTLWKVLWWKLLIPLYFWSSPVWLYSTGCYIYPADGSKVLYRWQAGFCYICVHISVYWCIYWCGTTNPPITTKPMGWQPPDTFMALTLYPLRDMVRMMLKGLITTGRELRQQHPSDLLSGGGTSGERSSGDIPIGQQIKRRHLLASIVTSCISSERRE